MQFPLDLRFKIMAISPQVTVTDAAGSVVMYVKQKAFKLKEHVDVYADKEKTRQLYTIAADRVIDWSAKYAFTDANGNEVGAVARKGGRSLWRAHYDVLKDGQVEMTIREENPWAKVADGLLGEVPVVGMFAGYLFHPRYLVSRADGTPVLRVEKKAAFLEGRYAVTELTDIPEDEEARAVLALLMMVLLERRRG